MRLATLTRSPRPRATTGAPTSPSSLGVATAVAVLAGRAARRRLGARQPARSRPPAPRPHRSHRRLDRLLPRGAGRRISKTDAGFTAAFERRRAAHRDAGAGHRAGERPPRVARAGLRRRRSLLARSTASTGRSGPAGRDALVSRALAADIGAAAGATILVRVERPSAIPIESLHGRKDDPGRTIRLTVRAVLDRSRDAASSRSGRSRARCARCSCRCRGCSRISSSRPASTRCSSPTARRRTNGAAARGALAALTTLEDVGLSLRALDAQHAIALESAAGLLDRPRAAAASEAAARRRRRGAAGPDLPGERAAQRRPRGAVLARHRHRSVARWRRSVPRRTGAAPARPPIVLNDWTARDLAVKVGDPLTLDYYVWEEPGRLETRTRGLRGRGDRADRRRRRRSRSRRRSIRASPEPTTLGDWDPPFPIDLQARPPGRRGRTGSSTGRRRRRSSRRGRGSRCGSRATAIARRFA